jgi:hypothetical protein
VLGHYINTDDFTCLDLYKQSVDEVPKIIKSLKDKGYNFLTAAACNNDDKPHTILNKEAPVAEASVGAAAVPDTNEVLPLSTQFPATPSGTKAKSAAKKAGASSAAPKTAYSNYALSFVSLAAFIATFL